MNTKKFLITLSSLLAVLSIVIVAFFMVTSGDNAPSMEAGTTSATTAAQLSVVDPKDPELIKVTDGVTGSIPIATKPSTTTRTTTTGKTVGSLAKPMTPGTIPSGNVQIGETEYTEVPYDCETKGHHCNGPETHAYILNLELKGCRYCGSHSCASFYAVDKWGNACYTPSECPEYALQKDPAKYCQNCGKAFGNGDNNTCRKWVVDVCCPDCGKTVKAWECHSHG